MRNTNLALVLVTALALLLASPAFGGDPLAEMQPARVLEPTPRVNYHPLVLVHGFLGFAEGGPAGLNYWGGRTNLAESLRARGFETYAVAVGPASSNWDRACELFAAIRGGRVDYGLVHARAAGHERYGRTYGGVLPAWGESRRVHLVGHSMGGQTSRLLVHLLEEGDAAEIAGTPPKELSPLFAGGHAGERAWVRSVTTLATPHDGTPVVYRYETTDPAVRRLAALAYFRAARKPGALGLDLRLEAWGLAPAPGECLARYRRRFVQAEAWWRSRDTGMWDGSPLGARELNLKVAARPDVYYFSWATEQTARDPLSGRQVPEPGMSCYLYSLAAFIGGYGNDPAWWPNDGIVSTCSMDGPTAGSADRIEAFTGEPRPGIWNFMGVLHSFDHLDLNGFPRPRSRPPGYGSLPEFYLAIAGLLAGLPE
jgi:triacylglycerol lipase